MDNKFLKFFMGDNAPCTFFFSVENDKAVIMDVSASVKNHCQIDAESIHFLSWLGAAAKSCGQPLEYHNNQNDRYYDVTVTDMEDGVYAALFSDCSRCRIMENNLRYLIQASPDVICFKDSEGRWTEVNKTMLDMLNITEKDCIGKTDIEIGKVVPHFAKFLEVCRLTDQAAWQAQEIYLCEEKATIGDSDEIVFDVIKVPIFKDNDKKIRQEIIAIGRDVTKAKHTINVLDKQTALMKSLFNVIPDMVFFKDAKGRYLGSNPAFCELTGGTPEEITGHSDYDYFDKELADFFIERDKTVLSEKRLVTNEEWVTKKNGDRVLLSTRKTPYWDENGNVIGVLAISRDITSFFEQAKELKDLNEHLNERVNEEVDKNRKYEGLLFNRKKMTDITRMMSSISHHWRQPLNVIALGIQNICQQIYDEQIELPFISQTEQDLLSSIEQLSSTIDSFSSFCRPNRSPEDFEVAETVYDLVKICEAEMANCGIEIQMTCLCGKDAFKCTGKNVPPCAMGKGVIFGYKGEFGQVVLSIFHNAIDATLAGVNEDIIKKGLIRVTVLTDEHHVITEIYNKGKQIPDEISSQMYNPYFSTKTDTQGTGLGLFNAKLIIENYMSGNLTFRNEKDGVTFIITLPKKDV